MVRKTFSRITIFIVVTGLLVPIRLAHAGGSGPSSSPCNPTVQKVGMMLQLFDPTTPVSGFSIQPCGEDNSPPAEPPSGGGCDPSTQSCPCDDDQSC